MVECETSGRSAYQLDSQIKAYVKLSGEIIVFNLAARAIPQEIARHKLLMSFIY
jgi:hypothetical protein